jgi:hyperosmotically inducible periplasmic protein
MQGDSSMSFRNIRTILLTGSLFGTTVLLSAQQTATQASSASGDNTTVNQRDQNPNEPTADQQKDNRSDRDITKQIRRAIVQDKSLSTYAHNVKIITQNGQVTLKGPVRSEDEKRNIEAKAAEIAGENRVTSELDIKPKN